MEKSISQPLPTRLLLILDDTAQRMWSSIKPSPVSTTLLNTITPVTLTIGQSSEIVMELFSLVHVSCSISRAL